MFRESLVLAKAKFVEASQAVEARRRSSFGGLFGRDLGESTRAVLEALVIQTLEEYGEVGIYDPEALARIDFLNHSERLVSLVPTPGPDPGPSPPTSTGVPWLPR